MSTYICSDLHLSHRNILSYCPDRRAGKEMPAHEDDIKAMVNKMNEKIISNFNSMVSQDDEVYILGDVAMSIIANAPPLIRRLNGKKYLVAGNHDKTLRKLIKNANGELDDLFVWIKDYYEMFYKTESGEKVLLTMSHYPMSHWNMQRPDSDKTSIHFHGHCHCSNGKHINDGATMDVGIDGNDLFPYKIEDAIAAALKHAKENPSNGHHD